MNSDDEDVVNSMLCMLTKAIDKVSHIHKHVQPLAHQTISDSMKNKTNERNRFACEDFNKCILHIKREGRDGTITKNGKKSLQYSNAWSLVWLSFPFLLLAYSAFDSFFTILSLCVCVFFSASLQIAFVLHCFLKIHRICRFRHASFNLPKCQ